MPCCVCGKDDGLTRECTYCGQIYCTSHRLPENHDCPSLTLADDETIDDIGEQTLTELRHVAERAKLNEKSSSPGSGDAPLDLSDDQLQQSRAAREESPDNPAKYHNETDNTGILQRARPFLSSLW